MTATKSKVDQRIESRQRRLCTRCRGPLRKDNTTNHCTTHKTCAKFNQQEYRAELRKKRRTCEVCGGPLRADNIYGVCMRTARCRKEHSRRAQRASYLRDPEAHNEKKRNYHRKNRER